MHRTFDLRNETLEGLRKLKWQYDNNASYCLECLVAKELGLPKPEKRARHTFPKRTDPDCHAFHERRKALFYEQQRRLLETVKFNHDIKEAIQQ